MLRGAARAGKAALSLSLRVSGGSWGQAAWRLQCQLLACLVNYLVNWPLKFPTACPLLHSEPAAELFTLFQRGRWISSVSAPGRLAERSLSPSCPPLPGWEMDGGEGGAKSAAALALAPVKAERAVTGKGGPRESIHTWRRVPSRSAVVCVCERVPRGSPDCLPSACFSSAWCGEEPLALGGRGRKKALVLLFS